MAKARWSAQIRTAQDAVKDAESKIESENGALVKLMKAAIPEWTSIATNWKPIESAQGGSLIDAIEGKGDNNSLDVRGYSKEERQALVAMGFKPKTIKGTSSWGEEEFITISAKDPDQYQAFVKFLYQRIMDKKIESIKKAAGKFSDVKDLAEQACEGLDLTRAHKANCSTSLMLVGGALEGKTAETERA
jgi:hypothetical protein